MIVLSRKRNQSIVVNNDITVVVVDIREVRVRLGIECPQHSQLHRGEDYEAIQKTDGNNRLSEIPEMNRKKAEILREIQDQLANAVNLEELLELERKLR